MMVDDVTNESLRITCSYQSEPPWIAGALITRTGVPKNEMILNRARLNEKRNSRGLVNFLLKAQDLA
jgi:hypothetical protein